MSTDTILQVGVKALLQNGEGKYLLLRRNPEKYPEAGATWDIVGGRIDAGSTLLENLKREIQEETALKLLHSPQLITAQDILKVTGKHIVRLTYVSKIEGEPILDEEHTEFGWFTLEEMKTLENLDEFLREAITALPS